MKQEQSIHRKHKMNKSRMVHGPLAILHYNNTHTLVRTSICHLSIFHGGKKHILVVPFPHQMAMGYLEEIACLT